MTRIMSARAPVLTSRSGAASSPGSSTRRSNDSGVTMPCHRPPSRAALSAFGRAVTPHHAPPPAAVTVQSAIGPHGKELQTAARAATRILKGEELRKARDSAKAGAMPTERFSADMCDWGHATLDCEEHFLRSIEDAVERVKCQSTPVAFMLNVAPNDVPYWMFLVIYPDGKEGMACRLFDPNPKHVPEAQRSRMVERVAQGLNAAKLKLNKSTDVHKLPWNDLDVHRLGDSTYPLCVQFGTELREARRVDLERLIVNWQRKGPQQLKEACEMGAERVRAFHND